MSRRDQGDFSSSYGTLREQGYEMGQKRILASPIHDAQDEHLLRSRQNLSSPYAVVVGAKKDVQHLGSRHNFSPRDRAVEGARKNERYSPSHHNFSITLATIEGSRKDEQYSHHNFCRCWATAGVARNNELYSRSHHNFSPRQAAVEGARKDESYSRPHHNFSPCPGAVDGARHDEQYSHSQHGFNRRHAATKEARLNRDRDKREYEMHRRQDRVDQFYSSPRGSRPGGRLEQRSPVDERELYHMSQHSRIYDYPQYADYDEVAIYRTKHGYEYKDYRPMSTSKQDSSERRLRAHSPHGAFKSNLVAVEESIDSHAARPQHQDYLLASDYRKSSQGYSHVKIQSFREESQYYSNNMAPGNSAMENRYEEKEEYINKSRDDPHHSSFKSCYRDSGHQQMLSKGNSSTSAGLYERNEHADAFLDSNTVPAFVEHLRPRGPHENCCTRPHLDLKKDHRVGYADMNFHQHSHTFSKHEDYLYENSGDHKDVHAARDGGYVHRPVIRDPTAESGMVVAEGSRRMDMSDAVDNYNDPAYTSNEISYGKVPQYVRPEYDRKHLHRPFLEEPFAESGLVIAEDRQRILRSRAGANKDEPGCISNDGVYSVVPVHDQTEGGHRSLRRQFMEEPIAQSGIVDAECFQRSHRSSAGGGEYDPSYISMDGIFQAEPDHGYLQRADMEEPTSQIALEGAEGSQRIYHSSPMRGYDIIRDEENKNLHTLKNSEYYLDIEDTSADFVRRSPQSDRSFGLGYRPEDEIYSYNYRRYANASSQRDKFKDTPEFLEDLRNQKDFGRGEKVKADGLFTLDKPLKRKYINDEEVGGTNTGSVRLRKWHGTNEARGVDSHVGRQGYKSDGGDGLHSNSQSTDKCNFYLEAEEIFDEIYRHDDSGRLNCSSSFLGKWENVRKQDRHEDFGRHSGSSLHQGKWKNMRMRDKKPFESGRKHFKGHLLSESSRRFDRSLHFNKRGQSYKPQNFVDRLSEDSGCKDATLSANLVEDEDLPTHNLS